MPSHSDRKQKARSRKPSDSANSARPNAGQVRLIAGQWGGRRLPVVRSPGLRPTGDRVRETLFNWLQPHIAGARCLDLFAGSGALGFEALSRYARQVVFVENKLEVRQSLLDTGHLLGLEPALLAAGQAGELDCTEQDRISVFAGTADEFLDRNGAKFDVVFIDPPFEMSIQFETVKKLILGNLANSALIYVESPADHALQNVPEGCVIHRAKRFGDVHAQLLTYTKQPG